jgi:hypothetical protein
MVPPCGRDGGSGRLRSTSGSRGSGFSSLPLPDAFPHRRARTPSGGTGDRATSGDGPFTGCNSAGGGNFPAAVATGIRRETSGRCK